jgi:hypothetical protein
LNCHCSGINDLAVDDDVAVAVAALLAARGHAVVHALLQLRQQPLPELGAAIDVLRDGT